MKKKFENYTQEELDLMDEVFEEQMVAEDSEKEDYKQKYLYALAECDNIRKRNAADRQEQILNTKKNTIKAILPVIDDFERAIVANEEIKNPAELRKAFELIHSKFISTLSNIGVKQLNPVGDEFDTNLHEAISSIPVLDEENKNKVVDCIEPGYLLGDKVIRYAKVAVGS